MQKRLLWNLIFLFFFTLFGQAHASDRYWVYFTDKGYSSSANLEKIARKSLSKKAIKRRIVRGHPEWIFDETDLPVYKPYMNKIRDLGAEIYVASRWLNAVSVSTKSSILTNKIRELPFVKNVTPVLTLIRPKEKVHESSLSKPSLPFSLLDSTVYDYGDSHAQIQLCNIHKLHNLGLTGQDVLITLIDSGFLYQNHQAFDHLDVLAEWDFVNDDGITRNEEGQDPSRQHFHGTEVLSVIGSFFPGKLIGPAFNATYALAKTENDASETRVEEDNWVAGVEWADSLGTDIISTSVGYLNFDNNFMYSYEDLDGQTMVTSKVATIAVKKGIIVVAAAGNEATNPNTPDWPYIISPADGLGVIASGAVHVGGVRAGFSSIGPTFDGRIKPDVMAMGVSVVVANPRDDTRITFVDGTSFSAPLITGTCALLLEKYPTWMPDDVRHALTSTASQSDNPDNYYGYGIVNAWKALDLKVRVPTTGAIHPTRINTVLGYTCFIIDLKESETVSAEIFNSLGQKVDHIQKWIPFGEKRQLIWFWPDNVSTGMYFAQIQANQQIYTQKTLILH